MFRWLNRDSNQQFLRTMPWQSKLLFAGAVFFTFANVGFMQDVFDLRHTSPLPYVVSVAVYSGLSAIGYAVAISVSRTLIFAVVAAQLAVAKLLLPLLNVVFGGAGAPPTTLPAAAARAQLDGLLCLLCVAIGYAFWVRLVAGEGARHLRLRTEIGLAERIHADLVPPIAVATDRLEVHGCAEPSTEVGGDLIDFVDHADGRTCYIADVSGHGVSAGAFMGMTKSAIRMKLLSSGTLADLLADLNTVVGELRSPNMFVTLAALRFDATDSAEVALAGHLPILHWRREARRVETVDNLQPPLGVVERQTYPSRRVACSPGDVFLLVTDGLTEVVDRTGAEFGVAGVATVLERCAERPLAELARYRVPDIEGLRPAAVTGSRPTTKRCCSCACGDRRASERAESRPRTRRRRLANAPGH